MDPVPFSSSQALFLPPVPYCDPSIGMVWVLIVCSHRAGEEDTQGKEHIFSSKAFNIKSKHFRSVNPQFQSYLLSPNAVWSLTAILRALKGNFHQPIQISQGKYGTVVPSRYF